VIEGLQASSGLHEVAQQSGVSRHHLHRLAKPTRAYLPFWGKAWGGVHALWMHSIDVAAVGYELAGIRRRTLAALGLFAAWQPMRILLIENDPVVCAEHHANA
jgi:hypothetical protein